MKKIILFVIVVIMLIVGSYYYFEGKTKEVILIGQVVGFEIDNFNIEDSKNKKAVLAASTAVGTITCVNSTTNEFVALGHSISNNNKELEIDGKCYKIYFDYVKKGTLDEEGRIIAEINEDEKIGILESVNEYGIFGKYENYLESDYKIIKTANRFDVAKGEAFIYLDLDGTGLKEYEVEVTRINYLNKSQNIRVTVKSEELIKIAGGIARGMSGAPLIQNGKIIGAINCVNPDNPLDAYAIFIDKLISEK